MRLSTLHLPTLKEAPKEAEIPSHQLLVRGGYIRRLAAGIYQYLPLAVRSIQKIAQIVREEMNRAGAQEVLLPSVQPAELWQESGRWQQYGPELLRFEDRKGAAFCLGPTHEEVMVDLVRRDVQSYRQLPLNLYQIQTKFRDEMRPRAGLMRGREFLMKDAYSFDTDESTAKVAYQKMHDAYCRIFQRCGLDFRVVDADPGSIGGTFSQEFQVLAATGEDAISSCQGCDYTANIEKTPAAPVEASSEALAELVRVSTPGRKSIEEVSAFLGVSPSKCAKLLVYRADGVLVAAMLRGDHALNEIKLKNAVGCTELELAPDEAVAATLGAPVGYLGPVGLKSGVTLYVDHAVAAARNLVVGALEADFHFSGANAGRDFTPTRVLDLRQVKDGDPCAKCGAPIRFFRGIEVGHIFLLGTKYSQPMKCNYLDVQGKAQTMVMGCYGIGVTRVLSAAIEQNHDERGMKLPLPVAPFSAVVVALNPDGEVFDSAREIYEELLSRGLDVLLDDRDERPGVKLKDCELVGVPFLLVVGKKGLAEGKVELRTRASGEVEMVGLAEAADALAGRITSEAARWLA